MFLQPPIDTCPAEMSDETTTHAIDVINSTFLDHRIKVKVIGIVKNFSKGQNAQFTGDNWIDKRLLWPFYLEFLEKHPDRKLYNKPTKTFNGIEFGLWLDPTKKSIARNRLFKWHREKGYFVNGNNPSAEMIAKGWMLQVVGQRINLKTPLFTPEGVEHLAPIIAKDYYFLTSDL